MNRHTTNRKCGDCRECCFTLGVAEIDKPEFKACEYQCSIGCGIYEHRPLPCRVFDCLWLEGFAPRWAKPNKTHAVPWHSGVTAPDGTVLPVLRLAFTAGFKRNKRVMEWARAVSHRVPVMLLDEMREAAIIDGEIVFSRKKTDKPAEVEFTIRAGKVIEIKEVRG